MKMKTEYPPLAELQSKLAGVTLRGGAGSSVDDGMCAMQAVAWLAGEVKDGHLTDSPQCACPLMRSLIIRFNDRWSDSDRQKLLTLVPHLVGSRASDETKLKRAWFMIDYMVRTMLPWIAEKAKRPEVAARLRGLQKIADRATAEAARPEVRSARDIFSDLAKKADAYAYAYAYAYADADADAYADADASAYAYAYAYAYASAYASASLTIDERKALRSEAADRWVEGLKGALAITE